MRPFHLHIPTGIRIPLMQGLENSIVASQSGWWADPIMEIVQWSQTQFPLQRFSVFAAQALGKRRRFTPALQLLETAIRSAVERRRFELHDTPAPSGFAKREDVSPAHVHETLKAGVDALGSAGARPFLAYGTLLGWARENDFIPGDVDIDVGIFADELGADAIAVCLSRAGFTITRRAHPACPDVIKSRHVKTGIDFDVVIFIRTPAAFHTHWHQWGERVRRVRQPFELRPAEFHGVELFVPDPPEAFLDQNYGDWRTPSEFYHFLISPEIRTDFTNPLVQLISRQIFLQELQNGRRAAVRVCLADLIRKNPESLLWPWVQSHLRRADPSFSP